MAFQAENFLACLHIPKLRSVVHGARGHEHAVWVEREAHDLHLVTLERMVPLPRVGIPNLRLSVEGASDDFVAVRVIEGHSVDDIGMLIEGEQLLARVCVPNFARAVVAARDELASVLVEGAVGQREQVSSQHLEQTKSLLLVFRLLLDELLNELLELRLA